MGRWLGGVFGNTKLASDKQIDVTGRYTISDQYYMRQEGGWLPPGPGELESTAASSAKAIYDSGNRTNGVYWLKHGSNAAYRAYCWIDANSGGGYHLVGKIGSNNPTGEWGWSGSYWNTSSEGNASNLETINDNTGVNRGYYQYTLQTGFRMALHSSVPSAITNYLSESKSGQVARYYFNNQSSSQNARSNFKSWLAGAGNNFDNGFNSNYDNCQANCNSSGFHNSTNSSNTKWGTTGNNENDCNSNDSCIGFGGTASGCNLAAGGQATHCGSYSRFAIGYIFVQ